MKKGILLVVLVLSYLLTNAAIDVGFENGVPTGWESAKGVLSTSDYHYKEGSKSLKWEWQSGDALTVSNLQSQGLLTSQVHNSQDHTFYMWVYNSEPMPNDSVIVSFKDGNGITQYYYHFYLNYKGWRPVSISYKNEMFGAKNSQDLRTMIVQAPSNGSGTFFIDYVDFTGVEIPVSASSTHIPYKIDMADNHWSRMRHYATLPHTYDGVEPTAVELADLEKMRTDILDYIKGSSPSLNTANSVYKQLNITNNPDGTVKGLPLFGQSYPIHVEIVDDVILNFARDFVHNGSNDSRTKFMQLLKHTLDQGYQYGCVMESVHHVGYRFRNYPLAVLLMHDELVKEGLWDEAYDMVSWFAGLDGIWEPTADLSNMDAGNTRSVARYALCFFKETKAEQVQYLKGFRDYLQTWAKPYPRLGEGLKPDYTGFHHNVFYPSGYVQSAYKFITWSMNNLSGTVYAVDKNSKDVMKKALSVIRLTTNAKDLPMSLAGRGGALKSIGSNSDGMLYLAESYDSVDEQLAKAYNRIEPANTHGLGPEDYPTGFWQLNYAPMGVYRVKDWVADIKGFTKHFRGQEIYAGTSQFSRYSSYGTLEILYGGGNSASGKNINGWDWNAFPGTTTIRLPFEKLDANGARTESTSSEFSGALRFGKKDDYYLADETLIEGEIGLFGMDFQQSPRSSTHNSTFKFKKSVFCVDGKMICLGSGINNNDATNLTMTTLFQNYLPSPSNAVIVNGTSETGFPLNQILDVTNDNLWMIDNVGTGYYIPRGNSNIRFTKQSQDSPDQSGNGTIHTGNVAMAYFNHGTEPVNSTYEYVVIPGIRSNEMAQFGEKADDFYSVLMKNTSGHVVKSGLYEAYALFTSNSNLPQSLIKASTSRCLAVLKKNKNGTINASVNIPFLKFGDDGLAISEQFDVTIRGDWTLESGANGVEFKEFLDSVTVLTLTVGNAEPVDFTLLPNSIVETESVNLSKTHLDLSAGDKAVLVETILPKNATNKEVTWISNKPNVATVDENGQVTAVSAGSASITATTHNGVQSAKCNVNVRKATDVTYTETFENMTIPNGSWGTETYLGDHGFLWSVNGKPGAYIDNTKSLYKRIAIIAYSEAIPGGISSFSVKWKKRYTNSNNATIDVSINGELIASGSTSDNEVDTLKVDDINISGDVLISISIGDESVAIDDVRWTTYLNPETSIKNKHFDNDYAIYPNPSNGLVTIENNSETEIQQIELFDLVGRMVYKQIVDLKPFTKTLFQMKGTNKSGTYILKLLGTNSIVSRKIQLY